MESVFNTVHIRDVTGHSKSLYHVAWNCDGQYLSVIGGDKNVHIMQLQTQPNALPTLKIVQSIPTTTTMAKASWHPQQSNRLCFCGDDKYVEVWDVGNSKPALRLSSLGGNLNLSWSRDGQYLVVGNKSEYFVIFDTKTGMQVHKKKFPHEVSFLIAELLLFERVLIV